MDTGTVVTKSLTRECWESFVSAGITWEENPGPLAGVSLFGWDAMVMVAEGREGPVLARWLARLPSQRWVTEAQEVGFEGDPGRQWLCFLLSLRDSGSSLWSVS